MVVMVSSTTGDYSTRKKERKREREISSRPQSHLISDPSGLLRCASILPSIILFLLTDPFREAQRYSPQHQQGDVVTSWQQQQQQQCPIKPWTSWAQERRTAGRPLPRRPRWPRPRSPMEQSSMAPSSSTTCLNCSRSRSVLPQRISRLRAVSCPRPREKRRYSGVSDLARKTRLPCTCRRTWPLLPLLLPWLEILLLSKAMDLLVCVSQYWAI